MSVTLPALDPTLAAGISALPDRLVRRATKLTEQQEQWQIEATGAGVRVTIGTATVTVTPPGEVDCDCLLAPNCAHRAAVIASSPIADGTPGAPETTGAPETIEAPETTAASPSPGSGDDRSGLTETQDAALVFAEKTVGTVVAAGTAELAVAERAHLMRAVHLARNTGLHRVAATLTALHADPSVRTLRDAALAVYELRRATDGSTVSSREIGTARRSYEVSGGLRLDGLWCEPVLTASGYAGVVTTLTDADGTPYTVNTVRPGVAADVPRAYRTPAGLGDLLATHAEISRGRMLLTSATVSAEGRLGTGRNVRASLSAAPSSPHRLPGGVIEVTGEVAGAQPREDTAAVVLTGPTGDRMGFHPSQAAMELGAAAMARAIASRPGTRVTLRARGAQLLAVRRDAAWWPDDDARDWLFPGLDSPSLPTPPAVLAPEDDGAQSAVTPDEVLARWAERVAVAGRPALSRGAAQLAGDVAWLRTHASPHRADLLERLSAGTDLTRLWLAVAIAASSEIG